MNIRHRNKNGQSREVIFKSLMLLIKYFGEYKSDDYFPSQVKFLANALLLIVRTIQDGRVVLPDLVQLSQKCTAAYTVSQRAHPQQEKVGQVY